MNKILFVVLFLVLCVGMPDRSWAVVAGDLDDDFGDQGLVVTSFDSGRSFGQSLGVFSTGNIALVGVRVRGETNPVFTGFLKIFREDGTPALREAPITSPIEFPVGGNIDSNGPFILVLPDDSMIVAFSSQIAGDSPAIDDLFSFPNRDVFLKKINGDFTTNASFRASGTAPFRVHSLAEDIGEPIEIWDNIRLGRWNDEIRAIARQPDGKIIIAGHSRVIGVGNIFQLCDEDPDPDSECQQESDRILDDYDREHPSGDLLFMTRLLSSGEVDSAFGEEGTVIIDINRSGLDDDYDIVKKLLVQDDGHIVLVTGENLRRFDEGGDIDSTFGGGFGRRGRREGDRVVRVPFSAVDATLDHEQRIVVGLAGGISNFKVSRYLADGSPDSGFGFLGSSSIDMGYHDFLHGITIHPDSGEHIVACGSSNVTSDIPGERTPALARFLPGGPPDPWFGTERRGFVRSPLPSADPGPGGQLLACVWQSDRKIVAAGTQQSVDGGRAILVRYHGKNSVKQDRLSREKSFGEIIREQFEQFKDWYKR